MKLLLLLVALIPLVLELSSAAPVTSLDPYGRVSRNSRMSRNNYGQELQDEDEEEADDEDEDEDDDELYDGIYPPDFNKLFPSPDATSSSRPEGGSGGPQGISSFHPSTPSGDLSIDFILIFIQVMGTTQLGHNRVDLATAQLPSKVQPH